eukprot:COSAG06_NODE_17055_length_964_cov_1.419653_1_plen_77_part_10
MCGGRGGGGGACALLSVPSCGPVVVSCLLLREDGGAHPNISASLASAAASCGVPSAAPAIDALERGGGGGTSCIWFH